MYLQAGVLRKDHADSGRHLGLKFVGGEHLFLWKDTLPLTLQPHQVADLNSLLKSKLNISDAPVMMAGAAAPAPAAAAPAEVPQLLVLAELLLFCLSSVIQC